MVCQCATAVYNGGMDRRSVQIIRQPLLIWVMREKGAPPAAAAPAALAARTHSAHAQRARAARSRSAQPQRAAPLHLFDELNWGENIRLVRLHDLPVHHHLLDYKMCLFEVEHDVELAHVLKVLVQGLHERVDELQDA